MNASGTTRVTSLDGQTGLRDLEDRDLCTEMSFV